MLTPKQKVEQRRAARQGQPDAAPQPTDDPITAQIRAIARQEIANAVTLSTLKIELTINPQTGEIAAKIKD